MLGLFAEIWFGLALDRITLWREVHVEFLASYCVDGGFGGVFNVWGLDEAVAVSSVCS